MPMEVTSLEVSEFAEFIKGDIIDRPNLFLDGFIEFKYLGMGTGV